MYSALKAKPRNILECSSGVSTIVLAQCAKLNGCGHVISLEHDSQYAEMTRKQLIEFQLQEFATVIDAPLVDVAVDGDLYKWYSLAHLPESKFELLVIDGPPTVTFGQASTAHRKCHG
jgi:predicted O-methyltransferase YrrM